MKNSRSISAGNIALWFLISLACGRAARFFFDVDPLIGVAVGMLIGALAVFIIPMFIQMRKEEKRRYEAQIAYERLVEDAPPANKAHSANGGLVGLMLYGDREPTLKEYLQGWNFDVEDFELTGIEDSPELRATIDHRGWTEELNDRMVQLGSFVSGYEWETALVASRVPEFWNLPYADFVGRLRVKYPHPAISAIWSD